MGLCFVPLFQVGIYQLTWIAWSVLSPAFIPLIVGGLYWKGGTKEGAYACLIAGSVTGFGWYYLLQDATNIHTFFAALVIAIVAYIVVSKMTKKPPQEVQDLVDYAKKFDTVEISQNVPSGIQMSMEQFNQVICEEKEMAGAPAFA